MKISRRRFLHLTAGAAGLPVVSRLARAQTFPTRPITIVDTFPPGGSTGIVARIIADKFSEAIGQQVIVDQRPGAGGTVGAKQIARSTPDGYTLMLAFTGTLAIAPSLYPNAGYDPRKDFAPVGRIGTAPGCGNGVTVEPLRHRQTKGAETDMFNLPPTAPHLDKNPAHSPGLRIERYAARSG